MVAALLTAAAPALGHSYREHGKVTLPTLIAYEAGVVSQVASLFESIAPGIMPGGLMFYAIQDSRGGDYFAVVPDEPIDETLPDFDVAFSCGQIFAGPGSESGIAPCDGAVVYLFIGGIGEGFTWDEF